MATALLPGEFANSLNLYPMKNKPGIRFLFTSLLVCVFAFTLLTAGTHSRKAPLTGFTIHFDFIETKEDAERLLDFVYKNGAKIINVVPPPHVWESTLNLQILKRVFAFAAAHKIKIILSRIDASQVTGAKFDRDNYLYTNILKDRGRLPSGKETPSFFCGTVGNRNFMQWQKEETLYYAINFSREPALLGFSIGMFNEPFASQRGSLLCFNEDANTYEIAQYTPDALDWWHDWLKQEFPGGIMAANQRYQTSFKAIQDIPLPLNEKDPGFGNPFSAYWDFALSINYWVVSQYEENRSIWHKNRKKDIPFLLQISGYELEKLEKGRLAFAALDVFDWLMRADALGISLYTNAEYPDHGHDSDHASIHLLELGRLLKKPVYLLESGYEDNGAVLDDNELAFFVASAQELQPRCVIYEFLKMSYDESFVHHSGKLIDNSWNVNEDALGKINAAFKKVKMPIESKPPIYIYDDPGALRDSEKELALRKEMIRRAYREPLVFIPEGAIGHLPCGSTLVVPKPSLTPELLGKLKLRHIKIIDSSAFL
jgi:hypothetical protein